MLQERQVGYPSVHASGDFKHPLHFGDVVRIELTCDAVGERSITCRYRLSVRGTACAELKIVVVAIDMQTFKGTAVPDDVRAAFDRFR